MNQSSNPFDGAQAFTLKVAKGEDGNYTASCPSQPHLAPAVRPSQASAINAMRATLEKATAAGTIKSR